MLQNSADFARGNILDGTTFFLLLFFRGLLSIYLHELPAHVTKGEVKPASESLQTTFLLRMDGSPDERISTYFGNEVLLMCASGHSTSARPSGLCTFVHLLRVCIIMGGDMYLYYVHRLGPLSRYLAKYLGTSPQQYTARRAPSCICEVRSVSLTCCSPRA